jgi:hypothetical protein
MNCSICEKSLETENHEACANLRFALAILDIPLPRR